MAFVNRSFYVDKPTPAFLFLMKTLNVKQGEAQKIVATGRLTVNGETWKHSGNSICGEIQVKQFIPQARGLKPIFTAPEFGLFEKPSGTLVHPTTYRTPYSMLDEIRDVYGKDANALHRIDMETSGLLLVSRNKKAERRLKMMFEGRRVKKSYLAWVRGRIDHPFDVNVPLKQNSDFSTIKLKMLIHDEGKPSSTYFEPIKYDAEHDATLLRAQPHTGRQHQIRVHLFHVKHPIIGDPIYGIPTDVAIAYLDKNLGKEKRLFYMGSDRLLLHAQSLAFFYEGVEYKFESTFDFEGLKETIVLPGERYNS